MGEGPTAPSCPVSRAQQAQLSEGGDPGAEPGPEERSLSDRFNEIEAGIASLNRRLDALDQLLADYKDPTKYTPVPEAVWADDGTD